MSINNQAPFNPQGKTIVVAANAVAPLGIQATVDVQLNSHGQYRIVNTGTVTVHLGVGSTAEEAQTNSVAAVSGTSANGIPIVPGAVEVISFPAQSFFSGISSAATTLYITPGIGL